MKRFISLLLVFALLFSNGSPIFTAFATDVEDPESDQETTSPETDTEEPAQSNWYLEYQELTLEPNVSFYLSVLDTDGRELSWSSDDPSVVDVETGDGYGVMLIVNGLGTTTVTADDGMGYTQSCIVTVREHMAIDSSDVTIYRNGTVQEDTVSCSLFLVDNSSNLTWTSSNEDVVVIIGTNHVANQAYCDYQIVGIGEADLTVTTDNGVSDSIHISVLEPSVLSLDEIAKYAIDMGQHTCFSFTPDSSGYYNITCSRVEDSYGNPCTLELDLFYYEDGYEYGVGIDSATDLGDTIIRNYYLEGGVQYTAYLYNNVDVYVTGTISFGIRGPSTISLPESGFNDYWTGSDDSYGVYLGMDPWDDYTEITWTTDNEDVVQIAFTNRDYCEYRIVGNGEANLIATTSNGLTASMPINAKSYEPFPCGEITLTSLTTQTYSLSVEKTGVYVLRQTPYINEADGCSYEMGVELHDENGYISLNSQWNEDFTLRLMYLEEGKNYRLTLSSYYYGVDITNSFTLTEAAEAESIRMNEPYQVTYWNGDDYWYGYSYLTFAPEGSASAVSWEVTDGTDVIQITASGVSSCEYRITGYGTATLTATMENGSTASSKIIIAEKSSMDLGTHSLTTYPGTQLAYTAQVDESGYYYISAPFYYTEDGSCWSLSASFYYEYTDEDGNTYGEYSPTYSDSDSTDYMTLAWLDAGVDYTIYFYNWSDFIQPYEVTFGKCETPTAITLSGDGWTTSWNDEPASYSISYSFPSLTQYGEVEVISSDENVAVIDDVNDGWINFTAVGPGTVTLTATVKGTDISGSATITFQEAPYLSTSTPLELTLDPYEQQSYRVKAQTDGVYYIYTGLSDYGISVYDDNGNCLGSCAPSENYAGIMQLSLTAGAYYQAYIYNRSSSTLSGTIYMASAAQPESFALSDSELTIYRGETAESAFTISYVFPELAYSPVTWEISGDENCVALSANSIHAGTFNAIGYGDVTLTATTENGLSASVTVHIVQPETLNEYDTVKLTLGAVGTRAYYFTPSQSGYYVFSTPALEEDTQQYYYQFTMTQTATGNEVGGPGEVVDGMYYFYVELTADTRYLVNITNYATFERTATVTAAPSEQVTQVVLTTNATTIYSDLTYGSFYAEVYSDFLPVGAYTNGTWSIINEVVSDSDTESDEPSVDMGYGVAELVYSQNKMCVLEILAHGTFTLVYTTDEGVTASLDFTVAPIPTMVENAEPWTVELDYEKSMQFHFTPSETGYYTFLTEGLSSAAYETPTFWVYIHDEDGNWVDFNSRQPNSIKYTFFYLEQGKSYTLTYENSEYGYPITCDLSVIKSPAPTALSLDSDSLTTYWNGESQEYYMSYRFGSYEECGELVVSSDDETVVQPVPDQQGYGYFWLKTMGIGKATVTVTCGDQSTTLEVAVKQRPTLTGLQCDPIELVPGVTKYCFISGVPSNAVADCAFVINTPEDEEPVAEIVDHGMQYFYVKGLIVGTTTITITDQTTGISITVPITVTEPQTIEVGYTEPLTLRSGENKYYFFTPEEDGEYAFNAINYTGYWASFTLVEADTGEGIFTEYMYDEDNIIQTAKLTAGTKYLITLYMDGYGPEYLYFMLTKAEPLQSIAPQLSSITAYYSEGSPEYFSNRINVTPYNASYDIDWNPENPDVVYINTYGRDYISLYTTGLGTTTVTGVTSDGQEISFTVTVEERPALESFTLDAYPENSLPVGMDASIWVNPYPESANTNCTFTVSDPSIATIGYSGSSYCSITGLKPGSVTVTATDSTTGLTEEITLNIVEPTEISVGFEQDVTLDSQSCTYFRFTPEETGTYYITSGYGQQSMEQGYYSTFHFELMQSEDSNYMSTTFLEYQSATASFMKLYAGTTYTLRVTNYGSLVDQDTSTIKLLQASDNVEGMTLSDEVINAFYMPETTIYYQLSAYFSPSGSCEEVSWSVDNPFVVRLFDTQNTSCSYQIQSTGTATITATSASGYTDSVTITVSEPSEIQLDESISLELEAQTNMVYSFTPSEDGTYVFSNTRQEDHPNVYCGTASYVDAQILYTLDDTVYRTFIPMEAGQTYYLAVYNWNEVATPSTVNITKATEATGFALAQSFTSMSNGTPLAWINGIFDPDNSAEAIVEWEISDPSVLSMYEDYGTGAYFKILAETGSCTVTATTESGKTSSITVVIGDTGHNTQYVAYQAPTCTEDGNIAYWYCTDEDCGKYFSDVSCTTEITLADTVLPATGCTMGAPTFTWTEDYACYYSRSCVNCGTAEEAKPCSVTSETVTEAGCETAGLIRYTAAVTLDGQEYTDSQTAEIPAQGHSWDDGIENTAPACETEGETLYTCGVCGETRTEAIDALGHDFSTELSCDETHHWYACNRAGCESVNDKTEHTWEFVENALEPGCTTPGDANYACVCGAGTHKEIAATGHMMTHHEALDPTCDTAGNVEYWHCDNCDLNFYDELGEMENTDVILAELGHAYGEVQFFCADSPDGPSWTAVQYCENDNSHRLTHKCVVTTETTDATCEENGQIVYTATATVDGKAYTDTMTQILPALGHAYGEPVFNWSEDNTCTVTRVCENDAAHIDPLIYTISTEITKESTCTEPGEIVYTAAVTVDGQEHSDSRTVAIPVIDHSYSGDWGYDETSHWHACTGEGCTSVSDQAEHSYSLGVCAECGYTATEGVCGDNMTWKYDAETHTVTFSGSGEMYAMADVPTWGAWRLDVTGIVFEEGITSIGDQMFMEMRNLSSVQLPSSLKAIGTQTFFNCTSLTEIDLPDALTTIGQQAFTFSGLEQITIPAGVTVIPQDAFRGITSLTSVTFAEGSQLERLEIDAFSGCTSLTGVVLPETVTYIGTYAFAQTALTQITIPASVTTIGLQAFASCEALTQIVFEGSAPALENTQYDVFTNVTGAAYYPAGDDSWTEEAMAGFGSGLTWKIYCVDDSHTVVIDPAQAPTCTETGLSEGQHCSACGLILTAQEVVPALGHAAAHTEAKDATCTENGNTEYWYCAQCGIYFADAECTTETTLDATVIPAAHQLTHVPAAEPSYVDNGCIEHWICQRCGKYFSDAQAATEITQADTVIEAIRYTIGLSNTLMYMGLDETAVLTASISSDTVPGDTTVPMQWAVDDPAVIAIDADGSTCTLTTLAPGNATIILTSGDQIITCTVIVDPYTDLDSRTEYFLAAGDTSQYRFSVEEDGLYVIHTSTETGLSVTANGAAVPGMRNFTSGISAITCRLSAGTTYIASVTNTGDADNSGILTVEKADAEVESVKMVIGTPYAVNTSVPAGVAFTPVNANTDSISTIIRDEESYVYADFPVMSFNQVTGELEFYQPGHAYVEVNVMGDESNMLTDVVQVIVNHPVDSGVCGENVTWRLANGTLTISGEGPMYNYQLNTAPWTEYAYCIQNVVFEEGVTTVGDYAFSDMTMMGCTSVTLADSITTIGESAFALNQSLESIHIGPNVTVIENKAFAYMANGFTIHCEARSAAHNYAATNGLPYVAEQPVAERGEDNGIYWVIYSSGTLFIAPIGGTTAPMPNYTSPVSTSGAYSTFSTRSASTVAPWFDCGVEITQIQIGDGITSIGDYAFYGLATMDEVTIPESVTSIGVQAFSGCSSLSEVNIPANMETIDTTAFATGGEVTLNVPDSASETTVAAVNALAKATEEETGAKKIDVNTVATSGTIGTLTWSLDTAANVMTFSGEGTIPVGTPENWGIHCGKIVSVVIGEGITAIEPGAFAACSRLASFTVSGSGFTTAKGLLLDASGALVACAPTMDYVTLDSAITSVGSQALTHADLRKVIIADSFTGTIASDAFAPGITVTGSCQSMAARLDGADYGVSVEVFHDILTVAAVEAGCEDGNALYYACSGCEKLFTDKTCTNETTLDAVTTKGAGHSLTHVEAQAAACTEDGTREHWYCSVCEKYFDADGNRIADPETLVIPAKGHGHETGTATAYKAPTCSEPGNKFYWTCGECGLVYSNPNAYEQTRTTVEASVLPTIDHALTATEAKAATCTEDGNIAYWTCEACGKLFSDEKGETEITQEQTVDKATGHSYEASFSWNEDFSECSVTLVCAANDDTVSLTGSITSSTEVATCTTAGKTVYTATAIYEGKTYTGTKEVTLTATGHAMTATAAKPATCTADGNKAYWTCGTCGKVFADANGKTETTVEASILKATGHSLTATAAKAATCTAAGNKAYWTCGACGKVFSDAKGTAETTVAACTIKALGHSYGAPSFTWAEGYGSCTAKRACSNDKSHVESTKCTVTSKTTPATCTADGKTVYTAQVTLDGKAYTDTKTVTLTATGHSWGKWTQTKAPTTSAEGEEKRTCSTCGAAETRSVEKLPVTITFIDVADKDYYATPVAWAVSKGITTGTSANTFSPNADCTRGQVVTFLWRAAGSPKPTSSKNPFKDVKSGDYFYNAVLWAVEQGITTGTSANTFSPNATCTRGQVATFLWRAQGKPKPASSINPFKDVKSADYYYEAVLWAVGRGVTNGLSATSFGPNANCNRGQIVTFLYRAYN